MKTNESVFKQLIEGHSTWRDHPCGTGSTMQNTQAVRNALPNIIERYNIHSMLDVPCGDHSWMSTVPFPDHFAYIGADIVESMIEKNRALYPKHTWLYLDAVAEPLPCADLVFVRDFFIHISDDCIVQFLKNLIRSGSRYLLCSNYLDVKNNIARAKIDGTMRSYDLTLKPYHLPKPLEVIAESYHTHSRSMALWSITDIEQIYHDK